MDKNKDTGEPAIAPLSFSENFAHPGLGREHHEEGRQQSRVEGEDACGDLQGQLDKGLVVVHQEALQPGPEVAPLVLEDAPERRDQLWFFPQG